MGYRFQPSSRHFIGTVEQTQRELNNNQIQNVYHLFDIPALDRTVGAVRRYASGVSIRYRQVFALEE